MHSKPVSSQCNTAYWSVSVFTLFWNAQLVRYACCHTTVGHISQHGTLSAKTHCLLSLRSLEPQLSNIALNSLTVII